MGYRYNVFTDELDLDAFDLATVMASILTGVAYNPITMDFTDLQVLIDANGNLLTET